MGALVDLMLRERTPRARAARWAALVGVTAALYLASGAYLVSPGPTDLGLVYDAHYVGVPMLVFLAAAALLLYALPVTVVRASGLSGAHRWGHVAVLFAAAAGVTSLILLPRITQRMWESMLARAVADQPLVQAIRRAEHETDLSIVVQHVRSSPMGPLALQTVRGCRPLEYHTTGGTWSLEAECPAGYMTVDRLQYRSDPGAPLERHEVRIGAWRYHYD